MEAPILKKQSF